MSTDRFDWPGYPPPTTPLSAGDRCQTESLAFVRTLTSPSEEPEEVEEGEVEARGEGESGVLPMPPDPDDTEEDCG